ILSLLDVPDWHIQNFFPSAEPALWEEYRAIYPDAQCDGNSICTSATAYAVRAGGQTLLVDAGLGPGPQDGVGGRRGRMLEEMKAAGIGLDEVELVITTHLHYDHVGWNATWEEDGGVNPTFPRARYMLPEKDWAHYSQPELAGKTEYLKGTRMLFDRG